MNVVTDADADREQNQPFEMQVSLTSKYGSHECSDVYSYSFGLYLYLIKKPDHNDKLLSTEATFFGFCSLC